MTCLLEWTSLSNSVANTLWSMEVMSEIMVINIIHTLQNIHNFSQCFIEILNGLYFKKLRVHYKEIDRRTVTLCNQFHMFNYGVEADGI